MQLTAEHDQLRRTVARFVDEDINPHVAEWEKAEQFPSHQVFKKMGDLGLLGVKYPEEDGANLLIDFWEADDIWERGQDLSLPHKDISDDEWCSDDGEAMMELRKPCAYRDWRRYGDYLSWDYSFTHVLIIDIFSKAIPSADVMSWVDMNNVINNLEKVIQGAKKGRLFWGSRCINQ